MQNGARSGKRASRLVFESLERRQLLAADFVISEFMADNDQLLLDGHGEAPDWIEIHNSGDQAGNLAGWYLSDRSDRLTKWSFADLELQPDAHVLVFASGNDSPDPAGNQHTNFRLNRDGEYLALVKPDGTTIASQFGTATRTYPMQFENVSYGIGRGIGPNEMVAFVGPRYFATPTPGQPNPAGINNSGPGIRDVRHTPSRPMTGEDLIISAKIDKTRLKSAVVTYRVMYRGARELPMIDDGSGADVMAGDGVFTAVVPSADYAEGEMVRYFVATLDADDNPARKPEFFLPARSAEFFGTVVVDSDIPDTKLPILEWFVEDANWQRDAGGNNRDYTFASIFHDGRFYDNVRVRVRGGVTSDQAKPNFKFDMYSGGRFKYDAAQPSVEEFNVQSLMGELATRTYMRNPLAYQLFRDAGHAAPLSFYTHLRQNGDFYGLVAIEEQIDATFLQKHGFDPEGALYKAASGAMLQTAPTLDQWDKATREHEDLADLAALTEGLGLADSAGRARFVFDNVNIPQVIHYLALSLLGPHHDRITHNYYVYRDTNATGEWSVFPWDMDRFFPQGDLLTNLTATPIFYGDSDHPRWPGSDSQRFNRLNDAIFDIPATREMFVTHLISVVDQWLNSSYLEDSVDAFEGLINLDAQLDNSKWRLGSLRGGVRAIKNTFATRRRQLANDPELARVGVTFVGSGAPTSILVPTSDDLGTDWTTRDFVEGARGEAWESGRWSVGFDRGTALDDLIDTDIEQQMFNQQKSVFLRSTFDHDGTELEKLLLKVHYDDAFVAYLNGSEIARSENLDPGIPSIDANVNRAHSGKNAEDFDVSEMKGRLVAGTNVLAMHVLNTSVDNRDVFILPQLIGTPIVDLSTIEISFGELDYDPESGNQDEEYITLVNREATAIDISGWRVAGGIEHVFQQGSVIPAGGRLFVSPNVAAFRARAVGPSGGQGLFVQGDYEGRISSRGDTIELLNVAGELVTSTTTPSTINVDLNGDGKIDALDIDLISASIRAGEDRFDLNGDGATDGDDRSFMIETILGTPAGDANFDGVFNSSDLVLVFRSAEYEDAIALNSGWADGDWDGDGDFTTQDLVFAFQEGTYISTAV